MESHPPPAPAVWQAAFVDPHAASYVLRALWITQAETERLVRIRLGTLLAIRGEHPEAAERIDELASAPRPVLAASCLHDFMTATLANPAGYGLTDEQRVSSPPPG